MYLKTKIRKPYFEVIWFFFILSVFFVSLYTKEFNIKYAFLLFIQIIILYLMLYFYKYFFQIFIKHVVLPTKIKFKQIDMSFNFRKPMFRYSIEKDHKLVFKVYLHKDYYKNNFLYQTKLSEKIKRTIYSIWQHVLLYYRVYKIFLAYVVSYCFLFGIFLLFSISISYPLINGDEYKILFKFFTFVSFSFWLYITIIILYAEAIFNDLIEDSLEPEIYIIYSNFESSLLSLSLEENAKRSNELIVSYINIGSGLIYVSFLTIISIILS